MRYCTQVLSPELDTQTLLRMSTTLLARLVTWPKTDQGATNSAVREAVGGSWQPFLHASPFHASASHQNTTAWHSMSPRDMGEGGFRLAVDGDKPRWDEHFGCCHGNQQWPDFNQEGGIKGGRVGGREGTRGVTRSTHFLFNVVFILVRIEYDI